MAVDRPQQLAERLLIYEQMDADLHIFGKGPFSAVCDVSSVLAAKADALDCWADCS